MKKYDEIDQ